MYSHKTNLNNILLIIKKYIKKYNDIYNLPYYKNIINQSEKEEYFNYSDYIINRNESLYNLINKNDELYPLISCYKYYNNLYNYKGKSKAGKQDQIENIIKIIEDQDYKYKEVHELCCGRSFLGKEISLKFNKDLIGYDINQTLLDYNINMMKSYNISSKFINKDLLNDDIEIENNSLITGLHCCGELHRNIIRSLVRKNFKGDFIIIPCCYDKHISKSIKMNNIKYKLLTCELEIPYQLLKSIVITPKGTSKTKCSKYLQKRYLKIKSNLFYDYLIKNNIIDIELYKYLDIYQYKERKYISIPDEFFVNKDYNNEELFWITLLSNKNFNIESITYNNYKNIIDNLHIKTNNILNMISYEEYYLIEPLKKLLEYIIIYDYAIYLQENLKRNIDIIPFVSLYNTPRNLAIISN
jgi:hypothetical protein